MNEQRIFNAPDAIRTRLIDRARTVARQARCVWLNRWARASSRSARRVAIRQLYSLDERLLRDIGIERAEIPAVVDGLLGARLRVSGSVIPFTGDVPGNTACAQREGDGARDRAA